MTRWWGALIALAGAYRHNGDMRASAQSMHQAFAILPTADDYRIRTLLADNASTKLLGFATLLGGQPNGRAVLDSVIQIFTQAMIAPREFMPRDNDEAQSLEQLRAIVRARIEALAILGRKAPPLVATGWFNQPVPSEVSDAAPGARSKRLDDGIIRIIEFGHLGCGWCARGRSAGERWLPKLPKGVRFEYYDVAEGAAGNDLCEGQRCVDALRHIYVEKKRFTYPIAIWSGPRDSTWEGGAVMRETPLQQPYLISAPSYVVVDGNGIIRWYQGGWSDDLWMLLTRDILPPLLKERTQQLQLTRSTQ